jgi:hypothetical protein
VHGGFVSIDEQHVLHGRFPSLFEEQQRSHPKSNGRLRDRQEDDLF